MLSYSVLFIKKMENLGIFYTSRSSHRRWVFCKNDVLKNFPIFTEKRLCWSHFCSKVAESSCPQHYRLKRLQHRCFSVNIVNFLRTSIMKRICKELSLKKLGASVLALLINADYILTGYELIGKNINSC